MPQPEQSSENMMGEAVGQTQPAAESSTDTQSDSASEVGQQIPTPPQSRMTVQADRKLLLGVLIGILLLALAVTGFYSYQYFTQSQTTLTEQPESQMAASPAPAASPSPEAVASPTSQSIDTSNWLTYQFEECGATFNYPPKVEPFYYPEDPSAPPSVTVDEGSGRYWQQRGVVYPNAMALVYPFLPADSYQQTILSFTHDEAASGYISAAVSVTCTDLRQEESLADVEQALREGVAAYNQGTHENTPDSYQLTTTETQRWGHDVLDVTLNESEYVLLLSDGKLLEVRRFGLTENQFVIDTRDLIFQRLTFK